MKSQLPLFYHRMFWLITVCLAYEQAVVFGFRLSRRFLGTAAYYVIGSRLGKKFWKLPGGPSFSMSMKLRGSEKRLRDYCCSLYKRQNERLDNWWSTGARTKLSDCVTNVAAFTNDKMNVLINDEVRVPVQHKNVVSPRND